MTFLRLLLICFVLGSYFSKSNAQKSFYIGPNVGFASNRTALETAAFARNGNFNWVKSKFYRDNSLPFGIQAGVGLFPKIFISLGILRNSVSHSDLFIDDVGFYKIQGNASILIPEKFDPKVKLNGYSFRSIHFDLALQYVLNPESRLQVYAFAGPGIAIMTQNKLTLSAKFTNTNPQTETFIFRTSTSPLKNYLVSIEGGFGLKHRIGRNMLVDVSGKYSRGMYTKILRRPQNENEVNNTPQKSEVFGEFDTSFRYRYDQYFRQLAAQISFLFEI
ncbi:hypothetical protein [Dyadobacter arcticus]|uniref:Outer membrane protein beta-barrel domain-containing protein n=1 Tax=Dyadobacter arcticus TaxID=1078754 RepID=A0ABX0USE9_9BACT|nr:hypothetical protein [Dyadobacter arcticus]NIJ55722.1 hypothetical protein [Dyadobacter arcticus]